MRASKSVYHPNGDPDNFQTVEEALDLLNPFSGILQYFSGLTDPNADHILFWDDSAGSGQWLSLSGMTITGTSLAVNAATTSAAGIIEQATAAEYRADTAGNVALTPAEVWDAMAVVALTDAATIAVDMSSGFDFSVSLGGNRTLGNPTNVTVGKRGRIAATASGATRTLNKGSNWKSTSAISWPISIPSGQTYYVYYDAVSSTVILVTGVLDNPA